MAVTFGGTTIPFGKVRIDPHEYALKEWGFPGVDDLDYMALGQRGRVILVEGRGVSGGISKATLEAFVGATNTLVGGDGTSYGDCFCTGIAYPEHYTDQDGSAFVFIMTLKQMAT